MAAAEYLLFSTKQLNQQYKCPCGYTIGMYFVVGVMLSLECKKCQAEQQVFSCSHQIKSFSIQLFKLLGSRHWPPITCHVQSTTPSPTFLSHSHWSSSNCMVHALAPITHCITPSPASCQTN